MPSTHTSLHVHVVFGTKHRRPCIAAAWQARLHAYLGGTLTGLGATPVEIGGIADHVHLLVGLRTTHCLADVLRELKKSAAKWVHDEAGDRTFAWQEGYAAFSVSPTHVAAVRRYIANQAEHHRMTTFREEIEQLLLKAGLPPDLSDLT